MKNQSMIQYPSEDKTIINNITATNLKFDNEYIIFYIYLPPNKPSK